MTNTPHADLHGKRVLAHLTDGTTTVDAQKLAVFYVAGPLAHGRRIKELGYDGLTQAAVETLAGQGDEKKITEHLHRGYISWRSQAQRDAEAILSSSRVWKATLDLGEELMVRGRMTGEEIAKVVGSKKLTDHQVWLP